MIHFVIGTRAQLFKMAPIMLECENQGLAWRWIYTAQHKDTIENALKTFELPQPDYILFEWDTEAKTMKKLWYWLLRSIIKLPRGKKILAGYTGKYHIVLTHGDTITTWWGALLGRLFGCKVMHVEAGLRSFNLFKPFPEEINRLITFQLSNYYACPGKWAESNLKKYKGKKINTVLNTQLDTLQFGMEHINKINFSLPSEKYVVASLHRYENIFNKDRFTVIINELERISRRFPILFVQHPATVEQLKKLNLLSRLQDNKNIELLPRLEYLQFIKAVYGGEFVITDGGGNQEELYYMGKPTLIFRNETERQEGIDSTAVVSKLDREIIDCFVDSYKNYEHKPVKIADSPSKIIVEVLSREGFGKESS